MRRFYTFIIYALVPFILFRLYWRGRKYPEYRKRISERFVINNNCLGPVDIWVHAVSLGEAVAATPLIEELTKNYKVLVTTMTPSGSQHIQNKFGSSVQHQYVPYDLPWCLKRFFKRIKARVGIIMETELWPNLIHYANKSGVSLILVNARISDKAFKQYKKAKFFFQPVLRQFKLIGAQSELDAKRYIDLGAPSTIVNIYGNIKFDLIHPGFVFENLTPLKKKWGEDRIVLIAASTHDDEEYQLLSRLRTLQSKIPGLILLIAPRRPERFLDVYDLCKIQDFNTAKRSAPDTLTLDTEVVVLDSMGELLGMFLLSDYAFVGGSLVPIGGHNVLEPIAMNIPVLCGPFMNNSKSICTDLKNANAILWTKNADDLVLSIIKLHQNPKQREQQIENATAVLEANKGIVAKYLSYIRIFLNSLGMLND